MLRDSDSEIPVKMCKKLSFKPRLNRENQFINIQFVLILIKKKKTNTLCLKEDRWIQVSEDISFTLGEEY